jgi:hypothetical protein
VNRAADKSTDPQTFIAFAPFGVGILCALFYITRGSDVYGWWIGARDTEYRSAFFELEGYFTTRPTRFYATEGMDLYRGWRFLYSSDPPLLDKLISVDDEVVHDLDRLQDLFLAEWLFFEEDAAVEEDRAEYERANFPLRHVNLRTKRLGKFNQHEPTWIYRSPGFDMEVLRYLQRYWPLDYQSA